MEKERDSFWRLERANRRKTVELVMIFILVYCFVGFALDLIFHTFRVVNHHLLGFPVLTIVALAIASVQALRAYFSGSSVLLGVVSAHDLASESAQAQTVADVVNEMALAARIPPPRLCLMEDPAPNAFATGRDPAHSAICVTRGLVDQMDREEMQGVIAHEIAHIRGHDTRIAQMATVMVGGFGLVSGSVLRSAAAQRRGEIGTIPGFGLVALPVLIVGGNRMALREARRDHAFAPTGIPGGRLRDRVHTQSGWLDPRARTYCAYRITAQGGAAWSGAALYCRPVRMRRHELDRIPRRGRADRVAAG
jgi:Zn-dependent protease with chaperone function